MIEPPGRDVIVIPVHNRREITRGALQALAGDGVMAWATILVVDDGSDDGTRDMVRTEYPRVDILSGDGTWWWCGAIRRGMEWALARGAQRIYWLNDDCRVPAGGLQALHDLVARDGSVAWIDAIAPGGWNYGAHRKTGWRMRRCTPAEEARGAIDSFSGNCVCLPRKWIDRVGLPHDHLFPHGIGDLDYGLRLHTAGAPLQRLVGLVATNADPASAAAESWLTSKRPMRAIWRDFSSPRSFFYFRAWRNFSLRHWGPVWGWVVFAAPYARWLGITLLRGFAPGAARAWGERRRLNSPTARGKAPN